MIENNDKVNTKRRIDATKQFAKKSQKAIDNKYDSLANKLLGIFRFFNARLDFLIINSFSAKILSLFFAIILFLNIHFSDDISVFGNSKAGWPMSDVPITIQYDSERYQIENLPKTIDLSLIGSVESIRKTRVLNKLEVIADLTNLKAGQNQIVTLFYRGVAQGVDVNLEQTQYEVNIYDVKSRNFKLDYDLIKQDPESKFDFEVTNYGIEKVEIKAAEHTLDKIARVVVLVDVSGKTSDYSIMGKIVVYDTNGKKMENLKISFTETNVDVKVSEKVGSDKKETKIKE